jgi:hypothetical protein
MARSNCRIYSINGVFFGNFFLLPYNEKLWSPRKARRYLERIFAQVIIHSYFKS